MLYVRPLLCSGLILLASAASLRAEIRADFESDRDPAIAVPAPIQGHTKRLKTLWLQALGRPEGDLQRMAADAFARGHTAGIPDLDESIPALTTMLAAPATQHEARLAAAQALVTFEAKQAAPQLAEAARLHGADVRQIIEPTLAAWKYQPLHEVWKSRLTAAGVRHRDLILAIRCLATVEDNSQAAALLAIVHDRFRPPAVRSEAARAAGQLQVQGLESDAAQLIAGPAPLPMVDRLCAVLLLAGHDGADALQLLTQLAADAEPAVAVVAWQRLIAVDSPRILPLAGRAIESADPKVRQLGTEAYVLNPDPPRVAALARLLDDRHPDVRKSVRESLFSLSKRPELDGPIRQAATEMLASDKWRGLEQAALLLAALDHKPAAPRLVELLEFERPEVGTAAAWGLKTLAVAETLPALLDKARRLDALRRQSMPEPKGLDAQAAQLFEAFGKMKYAAAEPLLVEYIPKNFRIGLESRKSAIWALGLLHAGTPDELLIQKLMARVADPGEPDGAEYPEVKSLSAISIARMNALDQVPNLRKYAGSETSPDLLGMSLRWALMTLTGESIPVPAGPILPDTAIWFLESLDDQ